MSLSREDAWRGVVLPLEVPIRGTCERCGGRGETWTEPCALCDRTGASIVRHVVRVPVPPRIADGACVRVRLRSRDASSVLVEVHVAICN